MKAKLIYFSKSIKKQIMTEEQIIYNSDPFKEIQEFNKSVTLTQVHIRVFKRNGKKCMTTLDLVALPMILIDTQAFITKCSKKFCCGGSYDKDNNIIKFSGDIRDGLAQILIADGLVEKQNIKIHGF